MSGSVPPMENLDVQSTVPPPIIESNSSLPVPAQPAAKTAIEPMPIRTGQASWYGPGFSGKKTASGDIFNDDKFTAAHKTLPLGTKAKVTNLSNGKSVKVEINDRGPYIGNRIIDLSQAAAHALGMIDRGVVQVRIEPFDENRVVAENVE